MSSDLRTVLSNILGVARGAVGKISHHVISRVKNHIHSIYHRTKSYVKKRFPRVYHTVRKIYHRAKRAYHTASDFVSSTIRRISDRARNILSSASNYVHKISIHGKSYVDTGVEKVKKLIDGIATYMKNTYSYIGSYMKNSIENINSIISRFSTNTLTNIKEILSGMVNDTKNRMKEWYIYARNIAEKAIYAMKKAEERVISEISSSLSSMSQGFLLGSYEIARAISGVFSFREENIEKILSLAMRMGQRWAR